MGWSKNDGLLFGRALEAAPTAPPCSAELALVTLLNDLTFSNRKVVHSDFVVHRIFRAVGAILETGKIPLGQDFLAIRIYTLGLWCELRELDPLPPIVV